MNMTFAMLKVIGVAALAAGIVLLVFAYNASNAPVEQLANSLTGRFTDHTMWYLVGGIVATVTGGSLLLSRRG